MRSDWGLGAGAGAGMVYGFMGLWVKGFMGLWDYGFMGLWVYGFMGLWVYGSGFVDHSPQFAGYHLRVLGFYSWFMGYYLWVLGFYLWFKIVPVATLSWSFCFWVILMDSFCERTYYYRMKHK